MSTRHGVGLVGLGQISAPHLAGYASAADRIEVVAVCDTDAARAASVARDLGARAYTNIDDLLDDERVVSVDLALPHHVHYPAARAALEAGKHVLVEKPMAPTSGQCRDLIARAAAAGLSIGVAENTPFVAAYQAVARLVGSGAIGEPRLARTLISGSEVARLSDPTLWKGRMDGSGGGTIIDAGPHSFYLLRWLVGELATVRGFHHQLVPESQVDDHAVVAGRFVSGALFTTEYTFTAEIPWGERLELYGSEGSIIVDQLSRTPAIWFRGGDDIEGTQLEGVAFDPQGWKGASIAAGVVDFADAVREGRPPTVSGADGLHGVHVAERAYESASRGGIELVVGTTERIEA
jgi:predicted dehydrogenase